MRHTLPSQLLVVFLLSWITPHAQNGILLNTGEALDSYTLFTFFDRTILIDNCGNLVNEWETGFMNNHAKLLPNGHLLYMDDFAIYEFDWEGIPVATTIKNDSQVRFDYEVILLPNDNYLCLGRRNFSLLEFQDIGFNFDLGNPAVVDVVVEIERETGDIVWEWRISDHVIQARDEMLPNYGVLEDNPQLLNLDALATYDWQSYESFMINGMDYNPELDQIALSVRKLSEVVIIDHSTTTGEAAGSTGGNAGKGGDILYRWGNPQNYNRGTVDDRQLFFQHNPNWITEGPYAGHLIIYDNGLNRPGVLFDERYSTVPIILPPMDAEGNYVLEDDAAYGPAIPVERYSWADGHEPFYSSYTSGAEWLENGNIFITEGVDGYLKELNPAGELIWEYQVPFASYIFRTEKYPSDYPGFADVDLTPQGPLEETNSTYECTLFTTSLFSPSAPSWEADVWWNPASERIQLQHELPKGLNYVLLNALGQPLQRGISPQGNSEIAASTYASGIYFLSLSSPENGGQLTKKLFIHE